MMDAHESIRGIDDISENLYDVVQDEIMDSLGVAGDELDLRTQRIDTPSGPVFVLRQASVWSAARARAEVLRTRDFNTTYQAAAAGGPQTARR